MLPLRIGQRVESHFFAFKSSLICPQRPPNPLKPMIFNHREPLFPLSVQLAFSFQIYAALPFSSLSGDPGEQAAKQKHRAHPPCYASHLGGQDSESQPVMLHFPQWDPGIRKRKAELRMSSFVLMLRPFFRLWFCFISSISLFPPLWQLYSKLHSVVSQWASLIF